ncbi:MAG: hypothetical protein MJ107_06025 [Lachnospiraceae bacterium]|nr:hypothetical protein [Lachnospiraceae bacterium]
MKKNNDKIKIYKGDFGYIKEQKKIEIVKTAVLVLLPILLYVIGFLTTGSNKNLLTFVAILGSLPMARSFVNLVLFLKAGVCCSEETYKKVVGAGVQATYYDLYYTSYKNNFPIASLILKRGSLIFLTEDSSVDEEAFMKHMEDAMKLCGGEKIAVKLFKDTDKYIERARELNALKDDDTDYDFILENLLSLSI